MFGQKDKFSSHLLCTAKTENVPTNLCMSSFWFQDFYLAACIKQVGMFREYFSL